ncbi:hypothetical protein CANCADRAFT_32838 [Tortispora caseinolytica NRRL Y-17796]|uniref:AB hydrolase-1 domain-containing protein n=1 Tax=Tortispora caseinolytica NRRL Y-17796 TaxID=767744 RepID=A0A1E4TCZ4_9ASCO|nr:hypothetical protein CANCADRAFT_32838 [Tortispora caseinolytica NRRL Y-17796]
MVGWRSNVHLTFSDDIVEVKGKKLNELLVENCEEIAPGASYISAFSLPTGTMQTVYAGASESAKFDLIHYGRELIKISDGAIVALDHVIAEPDESFKGDPKLQARTMILGDDSPLLKPSDDTKKFAVILHGLSGGSHESYVRATITALLAKDFECVVLNSRGCGRSDVVVPQMFNAMWTKDLTETMKLLKQRYPHRKMFGMGFSLGGSIMANYLGETGENCGFVGAAIIANPWDISLSNIELTSSKFGVWFSEYMAKGLARIIKRHKGVLSQGGPGDGSDIERAIHAKYLTDFDDAFTAPRGGFHCASEYYREASSIRKIFGIKVPTVIIHSTDDPIATRHSIPFSEVKHNPYLFLVTTDLGGHIGWFEPFNGRWFPRVLAKCLDAIA